jgi:Short C-terminal domain
MKGNAYLMCAALAVLSGCANPGIVKISDNTYMLSKEDHAGMFGNAAKLQADVIAQANAFAESQGKVAVGVNTQSIPAGPGRFAEFSYEFRVVDKDDPIARNAMLVGRPDVVVQNQQTPTAGGAVQQQDTYTQLLRLKDLLDKGVITQDEFDAQKKKILGEQ